MTEKTLHDLAREFPNKPYTELNLTFRIEKLERENKKLKKTDDLLLLIEQHKKEIWEWKQKESKWLEDKVLLDGTKKLINKLSEELMRMKNRAQEAEGETTIVKGIGLNSPEMKALETRVKRLDDSLANALEINESHQRYNGKLQRRVTELEEDNKKISSQVEDKITHIRKLGL